MRAAPAMQTALLEVAECDRRLAQLAHRERTLPERAELASVLGEFAAAEQAHAVAVAAVATLDRELRRAESDVEAVRERIARDRARMDAGGVPARELVGIEHEIASLVRRQADLEDLEIEVMERREQAGQDEAAAADRCQVLAAQGDRLRAAVTSLQAGITQERDELSQRRGSVTAALDPALLDLYERARQPGDVGAAALRDGRCQGCQLTLTPADRQRFAASDPEEVLRCEECRRILVRAAPVSGRDG